MRLILPHMFDEKRLLNARPCADIRGVDGNESGAISALRRAWT